MLSVALIVAGKEIVDHARDVRALASSALYVSMGPLLVLLVSMARPADRPADTRVLVVMMSVFTLLSAFTGAMSLAMDTVAGERERRSLLPLLLGAVAPGPVLIGKWLATCAFAVAGLLISFGAFTAVFALVGAAAVPRPDQSLIWMAPPLLALAFTAMALELMVSTACRTTKDAHTWLSILVFVMMALTMWLAFHPAAGQGWWLLVPIAGQQRLLETAFLAGHAPPLHSAGLTLITAGLSMPVLIGTRRLLQSDDVLYGR